MIFSIFLHKNYKKVFFFFVLFFGQTVVQSNGIAGANALTRLATKEYTTLKSYKKDIVFVHSLIDGLVIASGLIGFFISWAIAAKKKGTTTLETPLMQAPIYYLSILLLIGNFLGFLLRYLTKLRTPEKMKRYAFYHKVVLSTLFVELLSLLLFSLTALILLFVNQKILKEKDIFGKWGQLTECIEPLGAIVVLVSIVSRQWSYRSQKKKKKRRK